ncbi:MAG: hypothetical protein KBA26_07750 [Candidatus Delongbacteria bacterium]|nr:hypothetical protein [Candidatus Delongbacteria bacterium]
MNYYIGIDGGGTSSKGVLLSAEGQISSQANGGPSNINNIGLQPAVTNLAELILDLIQQAGIETVEVIGLGLSGAGREEDRVRIDQALEPLIGNRCRHRLIHHDAFASLMGASAAQNGVIAIAGTGSIVYGIKDQQEVRAGGWGYLLGDEGSGYYIGNLTIRCLLNDYDQLEDAGDIRQSILDFYRIPTISPIISKIYSSSDPKGMISSCCELVFELAHQGKPTALRIIQQSNWGLARQIQSVFQRLKMDHQLLFPTGSLFKNPLMQEYLKSQIHQLDPTIHYSERRFPPEIGMVLAALKHHDPHQLSDMIRGLERSPR